MRERKKKGGGKERRGDYLEEDTGRLYVAAILPAPGRSGGGKGKKKKGKKGNPHQRFMGCHMRRFFYSFQQCCGCWLKVRGHEKKKEGGEEKKGRVFLSRKKKSVGRGWGPHVGPRTLSSRKVGRKKKERGGFSASGSALPPAGHRIPAPMFILTRGYRQGEEEGKGKFASR